MAGIDRATICSYYIKSLRTGEVSAAKQLAPYLAESVVSLFNGDEFKGREEVLFRASGKWPMTHNVRQGGFSQAKPEGDRYVATAEYAPYVTGTRIAKVTFAFNDRDEITEVVHDVVLSTARAEKVNEIPLVVRGLVNDALANNTPIVVAYVSEDGDPVLSIRGSLQFLGLTQISAWLRNVDGTMATSLAKNPSIALLYRDNDRLETLLIKGRARIETDEEIRELVWAMAPEVEQLHTPDHQGACLIVDVKSIKGSLQGTPVNVEI